jgi:hypothetical protein
MKPQTTLIKRLAAAAGWLTLAMVSTTAQAVPSFSRQTGMECAGCHIGAFGPQLTPAGIKFKLGGYTDSDGKVGKIPLSAMLVASYKKDGAKEHTTVDEASIFLAGKVTDTIGGFLQVTHDGESHTNALDHMDLRYADNFQIRGNEALIGVSVNNAPTSQDPFNTVGAWSFPYTGAEMGSDFAGPGVEGRVLGVSAYTLVNSSFYGELGVYNSLSPSMQSRLGAGRQDGIDMGSLSGAPYWRLGYFKDMKTRAWSVGLLGFTGTTKDRETGDRKAHFNDLGIDASYQFLGNREHIVTVNASYLREKSTAYGTEDGDILAKTSQFKLATSYNYQNTYGATLAFVDGKSKLDDGTIDTQQRGYVVQADWTPFGKENSGDTWAHVRVGLQYAGFNKYVSEGGVVEKNGDHNRTSLFLWTAY